MSDVSAIHPAGDPWTPRFLFVTVAASVLVTAFVCAREAVVSPVSIALALGFALLGVYAWTTSIGSARAWIALAIAAVLAVIGLATQVSMPIDWFFLVLSLLLIVLYRLVLRPSRSAMFFVAPALMGLLFLNTASILGQVGCGGFPAAFAFLLTFILLVTHELELRTPVPEGSGADPHVHIMHRKTLAWVSIVFFLFGVISFWPWLGKIYGNVYFWVLAIGVLAPLLYLWGRIRQPRHLNSLTALHRFNRLVPYVGLVLLLAIALG